MSSYNILDINFLSIMLYLSHLIVLNSLNLSQCIYPTPNYYHTSFDSTDKHHQLTISRFKIIEIFIKIIAKV